jgi:hypothetical protein
VGCNVKCHVAVLNVVTVSIIIQRFAMLIVLILSVIMMNVIMMIIIVL